MKRFSDVLKSVCSIGTAIMIYICITKAVEKNAHILLYVTAAVFAAALTASLFFISSILKRIDALEKTVRTLTYDEYEEEEEPRKECPYCHAYIGESEEICPYCGNEKSPDARYPGERFETEDPNYNGTDFSGEEYVSAHIDSDDK